MATVNRLKAKRAGRVNEVAAARAASERQSSKQSPTAKRDGSTSAVVRAFRTKAALKADGEKSRAVASGGTAAKVLLQRSKTGLPHPSIYHPSENEPYMSPAQLAYFKAKLQDWRERLVASAEDAKHAIAEPDADVGDEADSANATVQRSMEAHTQDHSVRVVHAIDAAIRRIATGDYGYCEETGEEIGLRRLEANPVARLSIEAQERAERMAGSVAGATMGGVI